MGRRRGCARQAEQRDLPHAVSLSTLHYSTVEYRTTWFKGRPLSINDPTERILRSRVSLLFALCPLSYCPLLHCAAVCWYVQELPTHWLPAEVPPTAASELPARSVSLPLAELDGVEERGGQGSGRCAPHEQRQQCIRRLR